MRCSMPALVLLALLPVALAGDAPSRDPWLAADELLSKGKRREAIELAGRTESEEAWGLAAYLKGTGAPPDVSADRELLATVRAAISAGNYDEALCRLETLLNSRNPVVSVQLHLSRAQALKESRQPRKAAAAFLDAAGTAEDIGWLTQASAALYMAGLMWHQCSDLKGALAAFDGRLELERRIGSDLGVGRGHFAMATTLGGLGRNREAAQHLAKATRLAEETGDFEYLAKALSNAALAPARRGRTEEAMDLSRQSLQALDRVDDRRFAERFKSDPERISRIRVDTLLNLASWYAVLQDRTNARANLKLAVKAARASGDQLLVKRTRAHMATVEGVWLERAEAGYESLAQYDRALGLYRDVGDRILAADLLRRIGSVHSQLGDQATALSRLNEAIVTLDSIGARGELFRAHLNAGTLAISMGNCPGAEEHFGSALRLAQFMEDVRFQVYAHLGQARLGRARGDYEAAYRHLREAGDLQEGTSDYAGRAEYLMLKAGILGDFGDAGRAPALVKEAIRLYEGAGDQGNLNSARRTLAVVWGRGGRYDEAMEVLQVLLAAQRSRMDRRGAAQTLCDLADLHFMKGQYLDAARLRAEALGLFVAMRNRFDVIITRTQHGRDLLWGGEVDAGFEELETAAEGAEEDGAARLVGSCALGMAEAYLFARKYDLAADWALKGLKATEQIGLNLADGEGAMLRSGHAPLAEVGLSAAYRAGRIGDAFLFIERGRSATLLAALGGRSALSEATVSAELLRREEAARGSEAMAVARLDAARQKGVVKEVRARRAELADSRGKLNGCLAEIQRDSRRQADLAYPHIPTLAEVQQSLEARDALILYGKGAHEIFALVITRNKVGAYHLGPDTRVMSNVEPFLTHDDHPVNLKAFEGAARQLIDVLDLDEKTERVLISPGGQLAYVPFSLLVGDREVVMVPSATAYQLQHAEKRTAGSGVLAFGNPDYGSAAEDVGSIVAMRTRGGVLTALPGSRLEAETVGDVVLLGRNASETRFREIVDRKRTWRAVHLACHGLVDPEDPTISALALTADARNDGLLTSMDVLRMRIPADLVVLSACDTGRGKVVKGEGMIGLTRAFMLAGAPRVLCSLWKVDDEATRALMTKFYELWNPSEGDGRSASSALQGAMAHVRSHDKWRHPTFWAAWVLWGLPD